MRGEVTSAESHGQRVAVIENELGELGTDQALVINADEEVFEMNNTRLAFSPRKAVLASGSQDSSALLWEPRRGTEPIHFAFLEDEVTTLAWRPDHHTLLGADADGNIAVGR